MRGFTLIELLIVLAILGIIATVVGSSCTSCAGGDPEIQRISKGVS